MATTPSVNLQEWETLRQWTALTLAVQRRLPKKYASAVLVLFRAHPEVLVTRTLTLSTAELRLLWRCQAADLPHRLTLMSQGSQGALTFHLQEGPLGLGPTVHLHFNVPDDSPPQQGHGDV
jgi:hypothetical protein